MVKELNFIVKTESLQEIRLWIVTYLSDWLIDQSETSIFKKSDQIRLELLPNQSIKADDILTNSVN